MLLKKIGIPLAIAMIGFFVACDGSSKQGNMQDNENQEVTEIETISTELDSANVELDKEVSDLQNSLNELNTEN